LHLGSSRERRLTRRGSRLRDYASLISVRPWSGAAALVGPQLRTGPGVLLDEIARIMKALFAALVCLTLAVTALSLSGCNKATAADSSITSAGRSFTVQFRPDALGAAAGSPASPKTALMNGVDTTLPCTFKSTREDWVVVEREHKEIWIPKNVILFIRFE